MLLFDDLFTDDFFSPVPKSSRRYSTPTTAVMKTDIRENEDSFDIEIDLPGYKKEDVNAELKDGYMTISATRKTSDEKKDDKGSYIRRERYFGSCSRSFYVGKEITEKDIKARFEDGILRLNVPKKEAQAKIPEKKMILIEG